MSSSQRFTFLSSFLTDALTPNQTTAPVCNEKFFRTVFFFLTCSQQEQQFSLLINIGVISFQAFFFQTCKENEFGKRVRTV